MQIFEDSDEKQYDRVSIRKFVLNSFKKNVASKSMMKKRISSSEEFQLFTSDDTSSFESTSISNFVAVEISRFLFRKEISDKEMINVVYGHFAHYGHFDRHDRLRTSVYQVR